MANQTFMNKGTFKIECECAIEPVDWVRKQMLEKNGNGSSGLHFKRGQTFLNVETPPAINIPSSLCYALISRLTRILWISDIWFYGNGVVKIVLKCEIDETTHSACIKPDQRQSLEEAEFMVCGIVEEFVEEHPVE